MSEVKLDANVIYKKIQKFYKSWNNVGNFLFFKNLCLLSVNNNFNFFLFKINI